MLEVKRRHLAILRTRSSFRAIERTRRARVGFVEGLEKYVSAEYRKLLGLEFSNSMIRTAPFSDSALNPALVMAYDYTQMYEHGKWTGVAAWLGLTSIKARKPSVQCNTTSRSLCKRTGD
jgi:hypothetical protein